jgi:hypothetical protein
VTLVLAGLFAIMVAAFVVVIGGAGRRKDRGGSGAHDLRRSRSEEDEGMP